MQLNLGRCNTHEEDAYEVFDQMLTSESDDRRRPNRILEVTIHKVCYPITESLLRQVFGPFGVVENVSVQGMGLGGGSSDIPIKAASL